MTTPKESQKGLKQASNEAGASREPSSGSGMDTDKMPTEVNGPKGPEPTRYGDWEKKGRCIDF